MVEGGDGANGASTGIDRSTAGWLTRNGLVAVGVALVAVGIAYVNWLVGTWVGGYALLVLVEWLLAVVLPVVAIGLAVPGSVPRPGVPELLLTPTRRRSLLTGAVVAGFAGPAWYWLNWTLRGSLAVPTRPNLWVGVPLVLYGLWPSLADRWSFLGRVGSAASSRARSIGGPVGESGPPGFVRALPWLFGLVGVGLLGYGIVGFVRLSRMTFVGDASGAAIGIAVGILTVSVAWGVGALGLALASGPSDRSGWDASRSFVAIGAVLAIVGPFVPLLLLAPGRIVQTGISLQLAGVELIVAGIGWRGYDRVTGR